MANKMSSKQAAKTLEKVLDRAVEAQWERSASAVRGYRRRSPGMSDKEIAKRIVHDFVRDVTAIGAAGGAVSAVPGPGTLVKVTGGTVVETSLLLERASYMILGVAEAYGLELDDVEVRRFAILRILGMWAGMSEGVTGLSGSLGAGLGKKATRAIPMSAIHRFNNAVGKQILFKWAGRTGAITLGSVIPFGIGAGVGAAANNRLAKALGRLALKEFEPVGKHTKGAHPTEGNLDKKDALI